MEASNIYKLICLDVDGTLVNDSKEVTNFTRNEIKRIQKDFGVLFVLVSSRMPRSLFSLMTQLGLDGPVIAYNGALILKNAAFTSPADVLQSVTLPTDTLSVIHGVIQRNERDVHLGIFSNNDWYVKEIDYWALREARGTKLWPNLDEGLVAGRSIILKDRLHKVMLRSEPTTLDDIEKDLRSLLPDGCELFRSNETFIEISPTAAPKSSAVSIIQDLVHVDPSRTMAFGDNYNDLEMLKSVGLGIAMNNAPLEVKKDCQEITLSNNEDGVGYALRKYFPPLSVEGLSW